MVLFSLKHRNENTAKAKQQVHISGYPIDTASSDVNELEYISSLLQSESCDIPLREDGSIAPIDIKRLLMSRYGIRISCERIQEELFIQLAGSSTASIYDDKDEIDDLSIWDNKGNDANKNNYSNSISGGSNNKDLKKKMSISFHETTTKEDDGNEQLRSSVTSAAQQQIQSNVVTKSATTAAGVATKVVSSIIPQSLMGRHTSVWFDLVQLVAVLCIPELQRVRYTECSNKQLTRRRSIFVRNSKSSGLTPGSDNISSKELPNARVLQKINEESSDVIDAALKILLSFSGVELQSVTTDTNNNNVPAASIMTMELTPSNVRQMLTSLEEDSDDITDELINEMINVARTGQITPPDETATTTTVFLNRNTFLNALTADVAVAVSSNILPYEDQSTTHYEDAVRNVQSNGIANNKRSLHVVKEENVEDTKQVAVDLGGEGVIETQIELGEAKGSTSNITKEGEHDPSYGRKYTQWYKKFKAKTVSTIQETTTLVAKDGSIHDPDLHRRWTAPSIDMAVDTFKSYWWTVIMWFTIVVLFFSYFVSNNFFSVNSRLPSIDCSKQTNVTEFACKCMKGVVIWLNVFLQLAVLGTSFVVLSSFGNSIYRYRTRYIEVFMSLVGIIVILFTTVLAYIYSVDTAFFSTEKSDDKIAGKYLYAGTVVLGVFMLLIQIVNMLRILVSSTTLEKITRAVPIFAESSRKLERNTKCAAAYKMRRMIDNAFTCHITSDDYESDDEDDEYMLNGSTGVKNEAKKSSSDQRSLSCILSNTWQGSLSEALYRYEVQSHRSTFYPASIGNSRVWYELFITRRLGYLEGIWINPRLIASSLAQWLVFIIAPFIWIFGISFAKSNSEFLAKYSISVWEVQVGVSFGAGFSMISIFYLASVYVPSFVATVMSFRCGSIGSLKDPLFPVHRYALDQTTILYGAAFWGALFTCVIVWALAGILGFIVVWKEARPFVQTVLATIIGFLITLLLKLLILQILRKSWYGAFYRRKPAAVNVMNIILECWSLGLSSGYIIGRIVKLLLVAVFYIGRIDTPMLAPRVGWVLNRIPVDSFPIAFRKDILIHEAHRHPYIERLGMMFLLKLHNGSNFGCRACALWRILFVRALMPWLRKYRKRGNMVDSRGFSAIDMASNRKRRAIEYENEELRRENIRLRQQLAKQTRLQKRMSAINLDIHKEES